MSNLLTIRSFSAWARGTSTIRACLSSGDAVFGSSAPQGAKRPYIVYRIISNPAAYYLGGEAGIRNPLLQVECWGDRTAVLKLADAVRAAMSGFRGQLDELHVKGAFLRDERHGEDDPKDGSQKKRHYVHMDFELFRGS